MLKLNPHVFRSIIKEETVSVLTPKSPIQVLPNNQELSKPKRSPPEFSQLTEKEHEKLLVSMQNNHFFFNRLPSLLVGTSLQEASHLLPIEAIPVKISKCDMSNPRDHI